MKGSNPLTEKLQQGTYDGVLAKLYGQADVDTQRQRYIAAAENFLRIFGEGDGECRLFSAPGRTEICGNHTDHNHGRVVAGSVNLDAVAVVRPLSGVIRLQSEGYPMLTIDLSRPEPVEAEKNTSAALIRGTAARFRQLGYAVDGFEAYVTSNVLKGSGLSSSAAFEVLLGVILNHLYNAAAVSAVEIARIAQYVENVYFGKPCGLMDQMACSVGNIITIDFADPEQPVIGRLEFDFSATEHALCIVDVGGNHADLTHEYAAVPHEMRAVAASLGVEYLRETDLPAVLAQIPTLRERHGDRAVLRAIHFMQENERVASMVEALSRRDFDTFKQIILASGHSSFEYLQNVYLGNRVMEQGLSLALALAQTVLTGRGAWRVHGGGFGGTTQNFVPLDKLDEFRTLMENTFGEGSCHVLHIRPYGGVCVDTLCE